MSSSEAWWCLVYLALLVCIMYAPCAHDACTAITRSLFWVEGWGICSNLIFKHVFKR